jgi:hypothetical protein
MPDPRRPLGSERFEHARICLAIAPIARYLPDGMLASLIASAPPVEDAPPAVDPVEPQAPPPAERTPQDQTCDPPAGGVPFTIPAVVLEGWSTSDDQPGTQATVDYVRDQVLRGVSVDLGEVEADVQVLEEDEDGFPERVRFVVTQGSIAQCTITPFAAFPSAYIVLDEGQGAADAGVAPAAEPAPVPVAASGLRILEPQQTGRRALVAAGGIAPEAPPREWFERVEVLNPTRHVYLGRRPDGTPTGQVWGYLAQWGVPHAGILDREVYAPRLGPEGYRTFHTNGEPIRTAEGDLIDAGTITFGCGHDMDMNHGVRPAIEHYDTAGTAYADAVIGEDDFGPWFAGAMKPHLTRAQIEEFGRHPVSGDWRADPGDRNLRLVAALCVNTPGFEIRGRAHIAASGVRSLVAAGSAPLVRRARRAGGTDPDEVARLVDARMRPVLSAAARAGLRRVRGT